MQSAALLWTFDHHHGLGQSDLEPVATGEMARAHQRAGGLLGDQQTRCRHLGLEAVVMAGIDPLEGRAKHRYRRTALGQAALVDGPINALCQATHHRPARPGQGGAQGPGHGQAVAGRAPGADHGYGSALAQGSPKLALALPMELQGRPGQTGEGTGPGRIARQQAPMLAPDRQALAWVALTEGISPPTLAVGPHLLQQAAAEASLLGQGIVRGLPGQIKAAKGRLQAGQPLPADARAANPEQPPEALGLVPGAWGREQAGAGHQRQDPRDLGPCSGQGGPRRRPHGCGRPKW